MRVSLCIKRECKIGHKIASLYLSSHFNQIIFFLLECPEESPLMDGQRQHKNTPNGAANTCEVSPLLPDEGMSKY